MNWLLLACVPLAFVKKKLITRWSRYPNVTGTAPPYQLYQVTSYMRLFALYYINLLPEYELISSSTRFGQFQKFIKNWVGGTVPQTPKEKLLHGVWVLILIWASDLNFLAPLTLNVQTYKRCVAKLGPTTLIRGHSRGSKVVPLILWVWFPPISHQFYPPKAVSWNLSESLRQVQNRYIWLPLLRLTPRDRFFWNDLRKSLHGGQHSADG